MRLCDLPIEILIQIINEKFLRLQDHYSLATLSRILNFIAIPAFLPEYNIQDSSEYCLISLFIGGKSTVNQLALDSLSALAISINPRSINFAHCRIVGFVEIDELGTLAIQDSTTCSVSLQARTYLPLLFRSYGAGIPPIVLDDRTSKILTNSLGHVLNAVISRGCSDITLYQREWLWDNRSLEELHGLLTRKSSIKHAVHSMGNYLATLFNTQKFSSSCLEHSQIARNLFFPMWLSCRHINMCMSRWMSYREWSRIGRCYLSSMISARSWED